MGKLKKEKHNHKLTDFLKVGIFSLVMLAPFISIGSKIAYVALNKNAYQSYYGETINETLYYPTETFNTYTNYTYISPASDLNRHNTNGGYIECAMRVHNVHVISNTTQNSNDLIEQTNRIAFYSNPDSLQFYIYLWRDDTNYLQLNNYTNGFQITFNYISATNLFYTFIQGNNLFSRVNYNKNSYLDNVFEYAVNQLGETQIFAWTKNTAIYTPIETMTNGLGFDPDNNTLAILLTYWSLVTAVYVIMDIILFAFTKITHFTQD